MIGAGLEGALYEEDEFSDSHGNDSFMDDDEDVDKEMVEGSSSNNRRIKEADLKEKHAISLSRTFALFVLCLTAVTVGHVVFFFLSEDEHDDFRNSFHYLSLEIAKAADTQVASILSGLGALVTLAPLVALKEGEILPYFTSEEWLVNAAKVHTDSVLENVFFAPWIQGSENLAVWESYAATHSRSWFSTFEGPSSPQVWTLEGNETILASTTENSLFSPLWQSHPLPTNGTLLNLDLASIQQLNMMDSTISAVPFVSEFTMSSQNENFSSVWDFFEWGNETSGPRSFFFYPISDDRGLVGHVGGILSWNDFFDNVRMGVVIVVAELCGAMASYRVDEQDVQFLGFGDLHETGFESMEVIHELDTSGAGALLGCTPTLRIFPTVELEQQYSSNIPVFFTLMVGVMFAVSIFLFILYDKYVTRRQKKVEKEANEAGAIVSQLFPGRIRDMVIHQDTDENSIDQTGKQGKDEGTDLAQADFFPDVTIIFADIVGFTAWSSLREPQQVFQLLEATFSAFDEILPLTQEWHVHRKARRRRIFKIETVGDCYVAAAGLPQPRRDHAVAMARFSRDCLSTFRETIDKLTPSLGHDTLELGLRLGIHSGPVTAGVLRGERARFQLFGDTMNTCARLESTGMRNRIHMSVQTAELLRDAGKEEWLVEREDVVSAKGKGTMKT
eukprot:scaffold4599_cov219-Amphora_coffeaeformis.AAC.8